MENTALAEEESFLVFYRPIYAFLCRKCEICINDANWGLSRHLRQVHNLDSNKAKRIEKTVIEEKDKAEKLNDVEMKIRSKYLNKEDDKYVPKLPRLPNIRVYDGQQCNTCDRILKGAIQVCEHRKLCPNKGDGIESFNSVEIQTIYGGNKTKYFKVDPSYEEKDSWINTLVSELDKDTVELTHTDDNRDIDSFLANMRFQEELDHYGVSFEEAFSLCNWNDDEELYKTLRTSLSQYIHSSYLLSKQNVLIKRHSLLGSKVQLLLESETRNRYEHSVLPMLFFLFNIEKKRKVMSTRQMELSRSFCFSCKERKKINESMHSILFNFFFSCERGDAKVVPLFIACASVLKERESNSYRYLTGTEMSPLFSALLFLVRCVVVQEIYGVGVSNNNYEGESRSISNGWKRVNEAVSDNQDCSASYIKFCMDACNSLRYSEMSHVRFIVCKRHDQCGIVDGLELGLNTLAKTVNDVQSEAKDILYKKLMFGFDSILDETFWTQIEQTGDHFTEKRNGFSFVHHSNNVSVFNKWRKKFFHHMSNTSLSDGANSFNKQKVSEFIAHSESFLQTMYWLLQITSGSPARGTELSHLKVQNSFSGIRNLFLERGRLFYVIFYHKGREKREGVGKPIARFPDSETSNLLLIYIVFVRGLETAISHKFNLHPITVEDSQNRGEMTVMNRVNFLFSSRGVLMDERKLRKSFTTLMERTGAKMNSRIYRQYHSGIVKSFVPNIIHEGMEGYGYQVGDMLHMQAGHSVATGHSSYGVAQTDMRKMDGSLLQGFRTASVQWHEILGLVPHDQSLIEKKERNIATNKDVTELYTTKDKKIMQILSEVYDLKDSVTQLIEGLKVGIENERTQDNRESKRRKINEGRERMIPLDKKILLEKLRSLLKDEEVQFRSKEQEDAVDLCARSSPDLMIILPTGGGKSMTYYLPTLLYPEKIMLLVVPLVALRQDIINRCAKLGIQCVKWEDRYAAGTKIVVASAEHVLSDNYRAFIEETDKLGTLFAIFVEEMHLFLQWKKFRPVLDQVGKKIRPSNSNVPLYGISATCPPDLEKQIAGQIGLKKYHTIRQKSCRSNISYRFLEIEREDAMSTISKTFKETVCLLEADNSRILRVIVYCLRRKDCEEVKSLLKFSFRSNLHCFIYHGGMKSDQKERQFNQWKSTNNERSSCQKPIIYVMIATSAFGCGVDIPDVRIVFHFGMPRSIMGFAQESGRAGRDGTKSFSIVLSLIGEEKELISDENPENMKDLDSEYHSIVGTVNFGSLEDWKEKKSIECRRHLMVNYLDGENIIEGCAERNLALCDICEERCDLNNQPPHDETNIINLVQPTQVQTQIDYGDSSLSPLENSTFKSTKRKLFDTPTTEVNEYVDHSKTVTPERLSTYARTCHMLCAICSIKKRRRIRHSNGFDSQERACYRGRCLKCGSKNHSFIDCFTKAFSSVSKGCFQCSFQLHSNEPFHPKGTYGNRNCENKNAIRLVVVAYQDDGIRGEMEKLFPTLNTKIHNEESLVKWLGEKDDNGYLHYANVLHWILNSLINI